MAATRNRGPRWPSCANDLVPATIGQVESATADVGGFTASSQDFNDTMKSHLPLVFGFVLIAAFLLLLVTFRSIVIPIKAIVLNLLSVGAAYGVLVWIFQDGHLQSLLGFHSNGAIVPWMPLFLFVVLFGLSMDYHVFILTRIREAFDHGRTTEEAVTHGIKTTAGVVTSAAAVMISVFAIFATLSLLIFKQLGIGLAVAVLIDATLIRGVLLPATMKLLGDWNWYLPRWLEWLPRVTAETPAPTPARPPQPEAADATRAGRHLALRNTNWRRAPCRRPSPSRRLRPHPTDPTKRNSMSYSTLQSPKAVASAPAVALREVRKVHGRGEGAVVALDGVSVGLAAGSFTAIMGPSGSGKSTFLNVAAGLDRPTSGTVALGDTDLARLSERKLTILRRERIGFVFQAFNLMPSLTVAQNIALPLRLDRRRARRSTVRDVAARVGLEKRLRHRPSQLSGGQQQRVAIARALVTRPEVVFADEPTGALDTRTGRSVLGLLRELVDRDGHTVVMVTHDPVAAAYADRVILLADGRLAGTLEAPSADEVAEQLAHLGD